MTMSVLRPNWQYRLSKFVPVRMRSIYGVVTAESKLRTERASWWQWREHIFLHRVERLDWPLAEVN